MEVYLENHLTHILLLSVLNEDLRGADSFSGCLSIFLPVSEPISRIEREDGLWLYSGVGGWLRRPVVFLLEDIMDEVLQDKIATYYAHLALHLSMCMCRGSRCVPLKNSACGY